MVQRPCYKQGSTVYAVYNIQTDNIVLLIIYTVRLANLNNFYEISYKGIILVVI